MHLASEFSLEFLHFGPEFTAKPSQPCQQTKSDSGDQVNLRQQQGRLTHRSLPPSARLVLEVLEGVFETGEATTGQAIAMTGLS